MYENAFLNHWVIFFGLAERSLASDVFLGNFPKLSYCDICSLSLSKCKKFPISKDKGIS